MISGSPDFMERIYSICFYPIQLVHSTSQEEFFVIDHKIFYAAERVDDKQNMRGKNLRRICGMAMLNSKFIWAETSE